MEPLTIMMPPGDIQPIGIITFVHGMGEHRKRYTSVLEHFAGLGYICAIKDLYGHGENITDMDQLGYIGKEGYKKYIEDLHELNIYLKREYPGIPLVLLGHSMGSLIARVYCKKYDDDIDILILSGSPSNNPASFLGKGLIHVLALFNGWDYRSPMVAGMVTGSFEKAFAKEGIKNSWLSSDTGVATLYNKDPLCGFTYTLNGYLALLDLMTETYTEKGWRLKNPTLLVAFYSGGDDPCRTNDKMFKKAMNHMRHVGYKKVVGKLFPVMRHEIFNEIKVRDVYAEVEDVLKTLE